MKQVDNLTKLFIVGLVLPSIWTLEFKTEYQKNIIVNLVKELDVFVDYGRSIMLTSKNLKIQYPEKGRCQISLLQSNPNESLVGTLLPSVFPCQFKPNTVYYQHYGSMSQITDVLNLQARIDTDKETILKSFTMRVNIGIFKPLEILKNVENLMVDEIGGLSEPLSSKIISFRYNKHNQSCHVRFLPIDNGPPYYGSLVNSSNSKIDKFALRYQNTLCADFLNGSIRYAHKRSMSSANRDYLPLVIAISDKTKTKIEKKEYVQVPVRIRRAPENQPPIVNYNEATYSLQVDELVLTALTPDIVKVEDKETKASDIMINVTQVYQDSDGYLVHTDDPSIPVRTFYQKDIYDLKIAYKSSGKLSTSQRMHQIWMEAKDNYGATSNPFYIIVVIKPTNSFAPQVIRNEKLTMFEGQSRALSKDVLNIRDPDNESEVIITVSSGLNNGRLEKLGKLTREFNIEELDTGLVRYFHDGSDTYSDNIIFTITDGKSTLRILFVVLIIPQDDEAPTLKYNTGLKLDEGEIKMIDQFHLSSTDVDSDDTKIRYNIISPPSVGYIVHRQSLTPDNTTGWRIVDGFYEKLITSFSQRDIILENIFYRHSGVEVFTDSFTFYASDSVPNRSGLKTFIINIASKDDLAPVLRDGCTLQLSVFMGHQGKFSKSSLSYIDGDSINSDLVYKITTEPKYNDSNEKAGKIVSINNINKPLELFSQKQVDHFQIIFIPYSIDIGNDTRIVLFTFDVQDPNGNTVKNQTFEIQVIPLNEELPVFITSVLIVAQGERKNITSYHLNAEDKDTNITFLSFVLEKQPLHGMIIYKREQLLLGQRVTLLDIHQGQLQYVSTDGYAGEDEARFVLTDQKHVVKATLQIGELEINIFGGNGVFYRG